MRSIGMAVLGAVLSSGAVSAAPPAPYEFRAADGTTVAAELGEIEVPENRARPDGRLLRLKYVRFRATTATPGAPIVYLAGGPGGSGIDTARRERFPMFMALRAVADVIAFDQRGTGLSNDLPPCDSGVRVPLDRPSTPQGLTRTMREAAEVCRRFWAERKVDIAGYTTAESAADLDALRQALGASKITLWGISYGSHLAFAALKRMEPGIDRVVIASGEGLDQTVKMPAHTDAFFARFGAALRAANPGAATPDVPALMRRVHDRLDREPARAPVKDAAGAAVTLAIGRYDVQLVAASSIADPPSTVRLLKMYEAMDKGDFTAPAQILLAMASDSIKMRGMPEAMDIASGISDAQLAAVEKQAMTSLLADALNFPMPHLRGQLGVADLGDAFRAPVTTAVPTLLVMGTLDGRTYLEAQPDNLRGFSRHHRIDVENAGHNVWMTSPEIAPAVIAFLKGEKDLPGRIVVPGPKW
jgi:pimeloyl-ACP methyl ester carboxylesterase